MFKIITRSAIALATAGFVSSVSYANDFYAGGGLQTSDAKIQSDNESYPDGSGYGSGTGLNAFVGYRLSPHVRFQLQAINSNIDADFSDTGDGNIRGLVATGFKFYIPVANRIDLTAGFGLNHWYADDIEDADFNTHDLASYYSLGAAYYLSNKVELGFEYERHTAFITNVDSFGLYGAYHFGNLVAMAPYNHLEQLYIGAYASQFNRGGYENATDFGSGVGSVGNDVTNYLNQIPTFSGSHDLDMDDSSTGYFLFAGYQLNPWVGLEIGYVDFGDYDYELGSVKDDNGVSYVINETLLDAEITGVLFGIKGSLYRSPMGINLYARVGVNSVESEVERLILSQNRRLKVTSEYVSPYYGAGIGYQVTDSLAVNAQYTVFELDNYEINDQSRSIAIGIEYAIGSSPRRVANVSKSESFFGDYSNAKPTKQSLDRTTACSEKYRNLFFGCEAEQDAKDAQQQ